MSFSVCKQIVFSAILLLINSVYAADMD